MRSAIALLDDIQRCQFRHYNLQQATTLQILKAHTGMGSHHDFIQLHLYPFATDYLDALSHSLQGIKRLLLYLEIQLGGKADASHHAQRIVAEGNLGV